jgi:XRE family transcriptional regulator, master regulator for biofilm formation
MLGSRIKELREGKQLTQIELARKLRITQAYLAQLETGARSNPSILLLRKLAKALKVDLAELFKEVDHR